MNICVKMEMNEISIVRQCTDVYIMLIISPFPMNCIIVEHLKHVASDMTKKENRENQHRHLVENSAAAGHSRTCNERKSTNKCVLLA